MGMYTVLTDSNIQQIMEYGRSAAGFISVTDTRGDRVMLNVRNIISIREAKDDDGVITLGGFQAEMLGTALSGMFGSKQPERAETIKVDDSDLKGEP